MAFTENFIQNLKEKNDICEIVANYIELKRKGQNLVGLCPFHSEKSDSFFIYPSSTSFYCFGCGVGGDVITFLRMIERFSYFEAVKFLADRSGITLPKNNIDDNSYKKKQLLYEINKKSAQFFHSVLCGNDGKKALYYLKQRKISVSTIKQFGIGFAPATKQGLVNFLKMNNFQNNDIIEANLAYKNNDNQIVDRFWNRIMFPIIGVNGNVIAFGGRLIGQGVPKYLNSSDTLVFKKRDNLFSLNIAKKSHSNFLILVEGYMDAISLFQSGFENVVATLGTSVTLEQVKLISRFFNEVVISYDSDEAGKKAALRAIDLFKGNGISVRVINIENAKDPDEFLSSNGVDAAEKFNNLIKNSKFDTEYMLFNLKNKFDLKQNNEKINYLQESSKILAKIDNPIERNVYIQKLSDETGVDKFAIISQVQNFESLNKKKDRLKKLNFSKKITDINQKAEENLLSFIINNPNSANNILFKVNEKMFISEFNKKILSIIKELVNSKKNLTTDNLFENLSFEEISKITKIICAYNEKINTQKAVLDCISVVINKYFEKNFENIAEIDDNVINNFIKQKFAQGVS